MKKLVVAVCLMFTVTLAFAGNLRSYRFSPDMKPQADLPYSKAKNFTNLIYGGFSADNAILNGQSQYEVQKFFNFELQKVFVKNSVTIYDLNIYANTRLGRDVRSQEGTLKIESVNESAATYLNPNQIKSVNVILSGEIEYFKFNRDFENSFIAISLKFFDRDSGENIWLSTITGKAGEVIDYIVDALVHQPVDTSLKIKEQMKKKAEEDFASRLPTLKIAAESTNVVVKDVTKLPEAKIKMNTESRYVLTEWTAVIETADGDEVKTFSGEGAPPAEIKWDLTDSSSNPVALDSDYKITVSVKDEQKNKVFQTTVIRVSKFVEPPK